MENNTQKKENPQIADKPTQSASGSELDYDKSIFGKKTDVSDGISFAPSDDSVPEGFLGTGDSELSFGSLDGKEYVKVKKVKKKVKYKVIREGGGAVRSVAFTVAYITAILVLGISLGAFIIVAMNDVFAFSKDDRIVEFTVTDSEMGLDKLAEELHKEGIIDNPTVFKLYIKLKYEGEIKLQEGTFNISPSYNYDKLMYALNPPPPRETVSITFPEGITTDEIIELFLSKGIGTKEGFVEAIENADFEYWFLEDLETTKDRYYRLDGYLYPDTYQFYSDSTEEEALKKLLSNFSKKFSKKYLERIEELGLTVDEVVIIASMIEAEAFKTSDFAYVSAVFHNRLNSDEFKGKFESDACIQYVLAHEYGGRHEELTQEDLELDSPYNTRLYEGYPPGAICSPSLNALKAALYPDVDCGFYYFVADSDGACIFAVTYKEHLDNIESVKNSGM